MRFQEQVQSAHHVLLIVRDEDSGMHRFDLPGNLGRRCRHNRGLPPAALYFTG